MPFTVTPETVFAAIKAADAYLSYTFCRLSFINNNVKLIENLYELRWDNNLRIHFDMSMTKERAERFRECVLKYMNNDIIIDLINLSAE